MPLKKKIYVFFFKLSKIFRGNPHIKYISRFPDSVLKNTSNIICELFPTEKVVRFLIYIQPLIS